MRSQSSPVEHVEVASSVQPLPVMLHVRRLVLDPHCVPTLAQAFVQHAARPAAPPHAPPVP
jgi:hypothetical protein